MLTNKEKKKYCSKEEAIIFYLLNKALLKTPTSHPENSVPDLEFLFKLANKHKIAPTVFRELILEKDNFLLEQESLYLAQKIITSTMVIHTHIKQKLRMFSELFIENGIDFILIKGYAIDKSPLRQMNDLDVLIKEKDIDKAFDILQASGYVYVGSFVLNQKEIENPKYQYKWNNQYQFKVPQSQLVIEVHTNLFERNRIRTENLDFLLNNVDLFWKKRDWDIELHCHIPATEATLALLCIHSALKYCPAGNLYILRQAYDITNLLKKKINKDYFMYLCRTWKIEYYVYFSLMLTFYIFQYQEAERIALKTKTYLKSSELFLARIHLKTYRGLEKTSSFYRFIFALTMPLIISGGLFKALRWYKEKVFPPKYIQERRFNIKRNSPLIYLTYLPNPLLRAVKKLFNIFIFFYKKYL